MPREREEKPEPKKGDERPEPKKKAHPDVADIEKESSRPEASNHEGTAGDVYGR